MDSLSGQKAYTHPSSKLTRILFYSFTNIFGANKSAQVLDEAYAIAMPRSDPHYALVNRTIVCKNIMQTLAKCF